MNGEADARRRSRLPIAIGGIACLTAVSAIGTAAAPVLIGRHPLLVVALSPRLLHLAVAAASVPLPVFVAVATARLLVADPLHYLLGRHGACLVASRSDRARHLLGRVRAVVDRAGLLAVALRPVGSVLASAGACGLRPVPTALADVAGTVVQVVAIHQGSRAVQAYAALPSSTTLLVLSFATAAVSGIVLVRLRRPLPSSPLLRPAWRWLAGVRA